LITNNLDLLNFENLANPPIFGQPENAKGRKIKVKDKSIKIYDSAFILGKSHSSLNKIAYFYAFLRPNL